MGRKIREKADKIGKNALISGQNRLFWEVLKEKFWFVARCPLFFYIKCDLKKIIINNIIEKKSGHLGRTSIRARSDAMKKSQ